MESKELNDNKQILNKLPLLKNFNEDTFQKDKYCDALDETKNWCVGVIMERQDDIIKVGFDGWSRKHDITVNFKKTKKVTYFRKFSKGYTGQKSQAFRNYTYEEDDFQRIKNLIDEFKLNGFDKNVEMNPLEITQKLRGEIFTFIDIFMTMSYNFNDMTKLVPRMVELLYDYIDFSIVFLKYFQENIEITEILERNPDLHLVDYKTAVISGFFEVIVTLKRIFAREERTNQFFRANNGDIIKKMPARAQTKICKEKTYKTNIYMQKDIPTLAVVNFIDYFAENSGFELIFSIMYSKFQSLYNDSMYFMLIFRNNQIPLNIFAQFLSIFSDLSLFIDYSQFESTSITKLKDVIFDRINNMTENEIKDTEKSSIIMISQSLEKIFDFVKSKDYSMLWDELILNYHHKCLLSKIMDKRIRGITNLNSIIDVIEKKENIRNIEFNSDVKNIDYNYFFDWLKQKNIISTILGEGIHEEILKRALPIFKIYAIKNQLNTEIFDLLWKNFIGQHESIAIYVGNLISEISPLLNEKVIIFLMFKERQYILDKIKEVPLSDYEKTFLSFVKDFALNCLKSLNMTNPKESPSSIDYGISTLWNALSIKSTSELALDNLNEIFRNISLEIDHFNTFFMLCYENIEQSKNSVPCMILIKTLIESIIPLANYDNKYRTIIKNIEDKYDLISLIIKDFKRYMETVKNIEKEQTTMTNNNEDSNKNIIFEGFFSHKKNIESRLDLIYYLATGIPFAKFNVSPDHIEGLWDILILGNNNQYEKTLMYQFLLRKDDNENFTMLTREYLFNNILTNPSKFDFGHINYIAFELFKKYFILLNCDHKSIQIDHRNKIKIKSYEILGIDSLWKILLSNKNDNVRKNVSNLLVNLCLNFSEINEEFCSNYWNIYYSKLISYLELSIEDYKEHGIKGIIYLIKSIINEINEGGDIPSSDELVFSQSNYTNDYVFIYTEKKIKKGLNLGYMERVSEVRNKISYFFDIPLERLRIKTPKKILTEEDNDRIFRDFAQANSFLEVESGPNPVTLIQNNPKEFLYSNETIFKILFNLIDDADYEEVWDLLNTLPKNTKIIEEIRKMGILGQVPEINFFDSKSIHKLNYSLRIIKNFFKKNQQNTLNILFDVTWIQNFKTNGGINLFINILKEISLEQFISNVLAHECIYEILLILNTCLNEFGLNFLIDGGSNITVNELGNLLLKQTVNIFKSSYCRDIDPHYIKLQEEFIKKNRKKLSNDDKEHEYHETIRVAWIWETNTLNILFHFMIQLNFPASFIFDSNEIKDLLSFGLIYPKNAKIKIKLFDFLEKINDNLDLEQINHNNAVVLECLISMNTLQSAINYPNNTYTFFDLLKTFLTMVTNVNDLITTIPSINLQQLFDFMFSYIQEYDYHIQKIDSVFNGFLMLIREFIIINKNLYNYAVNTINVKTLLDKYIFYKCQKNIELEQISFKTETSNSKLAMYNLISVLSYNNPENLKQIIDTLTEYHKLGYWRSKRYVDWNISNTSEEKSSCGYVGLKNLGCTCYMNSLMQQFYMLPTLREALLATPDNSLTTLDESVLYQIKVILASLKVSEQQHHNPKDFCSNFKNYEGQPMNVLEQMDVDEFFNLLLDRLEVYLKGTENEKIFKYTFGGDLSNELICKGCPHYSERIEHFSSISLQVKNKKSIKESLAAFVEGEMLQGDNAFYCDKCEKKVDTYKRQSIKTLPRVLMLVLKRFEFNFDTMMKYKVNDYCEFPFELDMEEYTQEYLNKEKNDENAMKIDEKDPNYYKYCLSGVIIHTGTADSGHYYSIIKDKDNFWLEFNDCKVTPYDLDDLANEAYGGAPGIVIEKDKNQTTIEKSTNAYVLIYKRMISIQEEDSTMLNYEEKYKNLNKYSNIQENILSLIRAENFQYFINSNIFSKEYALFLQSLFVNYNIFNNIIFKDPELTKNPDIFNQNSQKRKIINTNVDDSVFFIPQTDLNDLNYYKNNEILQSPEFSNYIFKFACSYFFSICVRSKDRTFIPSMMDILKANINFSVINAEWLLEEFCSIETLSEFIIDCPIVDMRRFSVGLLFCSMIKVSKDKYANLNDETMFSNSESLINFIECILNLVSRKQKFLTKDFTYLYMLLWRFSQISNKTKEFLLKKNFLTFAFKFFMNRDITLKEKFNVENILSSSPREPNHKDLSIKLNNRKEKLTAFEEFFEKKQLEKQPFHNDSYLVMTFCEVMSLMNLETNDPVLTEKLNQINLKDQNTLKTLLMEVKSQQSYFSFQKLLHCLCFDNVEYTSLFLNTFLGMIENMDGFELEFILKLFNYFITLQDSLSNSRIKNGLEEYFKIILAQNNYYKFTEINIDNVIKLFITKNDSLNKFVDSFREQMVKLFRWLKENPVPPLYIPSKSTTMYKRKTINYQNQNFNQNAYQNYVELNKNKTQDRLERLSSIVKKSDLNEYIDIYREEMNLIDYKFSVKDKVVYEKYNANVISVLDEMIFIEYVPEEIIDQKKQNDEWVDTENRNLYLNNNN